MNGLAASESLVRRLARPDAFPHAADSIRIIETHISWIILTGPYAYKIKKPLNLGFLDFSSTKLRHHYCREEIRLNRRFAPELYLDVVTIGGDPDAPVIGAETVLDYAVRMVQFPDDARLDRLLARNLPDIRDMSALGESVARLHRSSPAAGDDGEYGSTTAISKPVLDNFTMLRQPGTDQTISRQLELLGTWTGQEMTALRTVFAQRLTDGKVRECHGDLHLENLAYLEGRIVAFDCLEFDPHLRWIDVMSEVAFLVMDLLVHERGDMAFAFLNRYLEVSADYRGIRVLPFYLVYRAMVRAKVAAVRADQSAENGAMRNLARHLDWACSIASREQAPVLAITHGLSGSGKTWLSSRLMRRLPAIRLRSDLIRKQMHGLDELDSSRSGVATGIYSAAADRRTYRELAGLAAICLRAGFNVIVDAACLLESQRRLFSELATANGARFVILACGAAEQTLAERIQRRLDHRSDASEANLDVLAAQQSGLEPLDRNEERYAIHIDTGVPASLEAIIDRITQPG